MTRLLLLAITLACACSDLPPIGAGVCGNGAIEDGEDCDGAAPTGTCGVPASANACHFVCDGSATCPDGFVCGTDSRCRAPGGSFATPLGPYTFGAGDLRAGDVDGDGFDDLVAVDASRVEVRFGIAQGDLAAIATEVLPTTTGSVDFGDLDGDGRLDLVLPTSFGVVTLRGSAQRTFDPFPYASLGLQASSGDVQVSPIQVVQSLGLEVLIAFDALEVGGGVTFHNQVRAIHGGFGTCLDGSLVAGAQDCPATPAFSDVLGGGVATGRTGFVWQCVACTSVLDEKPGFVPLASDDSDEVVVAVKGAQTVALLSAAETGGDDTTLTMRLVQTIAMPAGHPIASDGAVGFADMDGDGCNDLVFPVAGGGSNIVFAISYNDCAGNMSVAEIVSGSDVASLSNAIGTVRAFADFDGDGVADVVTDKQLILTTATGHLPGKWKGAGFALAARPWTSAVAVDINHDGVPDLAAMVAGEPDVDVLVNDGLLLNNFTVATSDPARFIVTGDFDGDLVADVGIVTGDDTSADENDTFSIVFGNAAGGPSAPVDQGHFDVVRSIAPLFVNTSLETLDGVEDLIVVTDTASGRKGALVLGSTDRQLVAPFVVNGPAPAMEPPPASSTPTALITGQFDTTGAADVLAFARGPGDAAPLQIFLLSGTGGGDLENVAQYAPTTDLASLGIKPPPLFAHGPLVAGAADSLVGIHSPVLGTAGSQCSVISTQLLAAPPPPAGIQPYDDSTSWSIAPPVDVPPMAGSCQKIHALQMADVDGDGVDETLIDVCDATANSGGICTGAVIPTVAGMPDLAHAVIVSPADVSCTRFAPLQLDADPDLELIAPCTGASGSFLLLLDLQAGVWVELARLPVGRLDEPRISVADFNGDKIPDVAVATGSGPGTQVSVYIQCAKGDPRCGL